VNPFKKIFSKSGISSGPSWYIAQDSRKHARQIVLEIPAGCGVAPQVANLLPPGESFMFTRQPWAAIILHMPPPDDGPFIFIRAEGVTEQFKGRPIRVAYSFYRMNTGGLFTAFVHVDSPSIEKRSGNPAIFENHQNISQADTCERIQKLIARGKIDVCFTASGKNGPCTGYFGVSALISLECQDALHKEWKQLIEYHNSVQATHRNFQQAVGQYEQENPIQENPVLRR
jgi:hypothetical protein